MLDELRAPSQYADQMSDESSGPSFDEAFRRSFSNHKEFLRALKDDIERHERKRGVLNCAKVNQPSSKFAISTIYMQFIRLLWCFPHQGD